ncbi:head-tail adaptor, putative [Pseudooceanicola batsensis HTCC2597]|uniref:Head-tail adaptor, putative n=1 Tax=Pseudooceanicola batsensis (strain ATCC BAA-863 / DSM 15984 / KCTC 12145 / HTCC2597) TaxID=252305 RepID=A3U3P6_PSEBH|nr:head-tail adaptor protein [Pseudooceanicola batsensis]EAQ01248.1 head-tail adaptor, putative [Pseudooceanicola batsensis HTCC2597]
MTAHLNRLLKLEDPQRVPDASGGFTEVWVELGEVWADVTARTGRGTEYGQVATGRTAYRIVVRGAPVGVVSRPQAGQRFREGARLFRIEAVAERDPQGRFLTCFATEEVAA